VPPRSRRRLPRTPLCSPSRRRRDGVAADVTSSLPSAGIEVQLVALGRGLFAAVMLMVENGLAASEGVSQAVSSPSCALTMSVSMSEVSSRGGC